MKNEPEFVQASVNYPFYGKSKGKKKKKVKHRGMEPEKSSLWETIFDECMAKKGMK